MASPFFSDWIAAYPDTQIADFSDRHISGSLDTRQAEKRPCPLNGRAGQPLKPRAAKIILPASRIDGDPRIRLSASLARQTLDAWRGQRFSLYLNKIKNGNAMDLMQRFGLEAFSGGPPPEEANENLPIMREGQTPYDFLLWLEKTRREMREELSRDFRLRMDPKHRRHWHSLEMMEQWFRWRQSSQHRQP
jgi:hypothetical protein